VELGRCQQARASQIAVIDLQVLNHAAGGRTFPYRRILVDPTRLRLRNR
jgi:hypothetical protein